MKTDSSASDAAEQVLRLVQTGRLFELQDWIKHNKPIRLPGADGNDSSLLCAAVETGFHSMVEVLLRAGGWSQADLGDALELAQESKHFGIAELLESSGARPKPMDFQTCCEKLDLFMMERHLRAGTDPNQDNVFAQALSSMKARPLLGFYRQFRGEFPALDDQAALALAEAVRHRHVRWTALLAWAGADPFRQVPYDLSESFPVDRENATMAAKEAVWSGHPEILKALKLKPTASQAIELLSGYVFLENFKLFKTLLNEAAARRSGAGAPRP